ncbi:MAG: Stk1 family PASTA domain-containing Ser/Thr kinase [Firmicutes bacterium]|nr:Stk1 family PASTA domain-containing Ser/Thr kinase [Bacillota bacterium]
MIGTKLVNRYQIIERIGGGGMAVVYKARCTLLNRIVAVKVLRQQFASDEDFVRRFRREAQAAASLSHPNIVSIYDVGQEKDIYFIVMEYVEGETLKALINREAPLDTGRAVAITRQIANALFHAHNNKIIHRDIKPHNVLIAKDGRVKVTDFGIARAVTTTTQTFAPNSIMGSVHYLSPEQAKGKLATEQSDIYSLGIVLYEMLSKALPFDGDSAVGIALKHLQQEVPPLTTYNQSVTDGVMRILDKMLVKDRKQRYHSVSELLADLRSWNQTKKLEAAGEDEESAEDDDAETRIFTPVSESRTNKDKLKRIGLYSGIGLLSLAVIFLLYLGFRGLAGFFIVAEVTVPDVEGKELSEAIEILEESNLRYEVTEYIHHNVIPEDHVVIQRPNARRVVKENRVIELVVSRGPDMVELPSLQGKELREARSILDNLRLSYNDPVEEFNNDVPANHVIRHEPEAGPVRRSESVTLYVSRGPRPIGMPDLVGMTEEEAKAAAREEGLNPTIIPYENPLGAPGGIVISHFPAAGEDIQPGEQVDIRLRAFERKEVEIVLTDLDPDADYEVRIEVVDVTGPRSTIYDTVRQQSEWSRVVWGWERGEIRVYVEGQLQQELDF